MRDLDLVAKIAIWVIAALIVIAAVVPGGWILSILIGWYLLKVAIKHGTGVSVEERKWMK